MTEFVSGQSNKTITRRSVHGAIAGLAAMPLFAAKLPLTPLVTTREGVTVSIRDLTARFLDFYVSAQGKNADERFVIWKDRYDFAAVPPTPQGDVIARQLLDAAWPRYQAALSVIRRGAAAVRPAPLAVAIHLADLLQAPRPLHIGVVAYVGGFETNAFTNATPDGPVVAIPVEIDDTTRAMLLAHEMTHAVQIIVGNLSSGYERSVARVIFEEGLAMHAVNRLVPGHPAYRYVGRYVGDKPWFDAAIADRQGILASLLPELERSDADTLFKLTMGQGNTGREREAYVAGWIVVASLLDNGSSLAALARTPEADMPTLVRAAIAAIA